MSRSISIAALKNRLNTHLTRVREGEEIIIRDRRGPIAKLVPVRDLDWETEERSPINAGLVRPAEGRLPKSFWGMAMPRVPARRVAAAVRWARGGR